MCIVVVVRTRLQSGLQVQAHLQRGPFVVTVRTRLLCGPRSVLHVCLRPEHRVVWAHKGALIPERPPESADRHYNRVHSKVTWLSDRCVVFISRPREHHVLCVL